MEEIKYKIVLSDNIEFFIEQHVMNHIPTLVHMFDKKQKDATDKYTVELENIDGKIFSQIITFVRYNIANLSDTSFIDKQIETMNVNNLFDMIITSNYLGIVDIVDKAVEKFKYMINNDINKINQFINSKDNKNKDQDLDQNKNKNNIQDQETFDFTWEEVNNT